MTDGPKNHPFKQVDVFSRTPFNGNPVAVVFDAEGLDTAVMQKIAAWTNLSETTFLLPPTVPAADYRLRIFAPRNEMRFAGHPTLGSAHAALEAGLIRPRNGRLVQECLAGSVALRVEEAGPSRTLWVTVPTPRCELLPQDSAKALESALGCKGRAGAPAIVDVGPRWLIMNAASAAIVDGRRNDLRPPARRACGREGALICTGRGRARGFRLRQRKRRRRGLHASRRHARRVRGWVRRQPGEGIRPRRRRPREVRGHCRHRDRRVSRHMHRRVAPDRRRSATRRVVNGTC